MVLLLAAVVGLVAITPRLPCSDTPASALKSRGVGVIAASGNAAGPFRYAPDAEAFSLDFDFRQVQFDLLEGWLAILMSCDGPTLEETRAMARQSGFVAAYMPDHASKSRLIIPGVKGFTVKTPTGSAVAPPAWCTWCATCCGSAFGRCPSRAIC